MIKKIRIGNDLVYIPRFEKALSVGNFIKKIFHENEIKYCESQHKRKKIACYAARFAAKEAFSKALGTGLYAQGVSFRDVWIEKETNGRPLLHMSKKILLLLQQEHLSGQDVSLSHEKNYASAVVILFETEPNVTSQNLRALKNA
jgi:holo-[acyl-carrier protein] synthase